MEKDAPRFNPWVPPGGTSMPSQDGRLEPHLGEARRDGATTAAQATPDPEAVRSILEGNRDRGPIARRSFFSDRIDRSLFLLFAGLGITIVAVMKLGYGVYTLWSAVPPVAMLVFYAWLVHRQPYFRLHPDRLGDNCYYMGFILTLASLAFALMQLETRDGSARASLLDSLIGNFGIALFSTIAGIALRVFFIQFRREIEDEEEQIRQDLQSVATRLKDQLSLAVLDLEGFRVRTGQVLEERLINAAGEFARIQKGMAEQAGSAADQLTAFQTNLTKRATSVAEEMTRSANAMTGNADRISTEMGKLISRVEAIEAPSDVLLRPIRQTETRIVHLAKVLEKLTESDAKRAEAFGQATDAMVRQLATLSDTSRFDGLNHAAARLDQQILTTTSSMSRYEQAIEGLAAAAAHEQAALAAIREVLQQDARNSAAALQSLESTLADIARGIAARLG